LLSLTYLQARLQKIEINETMLSIQTQAIRLMI